MTISKEVRNKVLSIVKKNIADASKYYKRDFKMPVVEFTKGGTTAGVAHVTQNKVNYNPILLRDNLDAFLARTVPHEIAHIIDYQVNPQNHQSNLTYSSNGTIRRKKRDIHGPDFQFIMIRVLGCKDATRCHSYDTSGVRKTRKTFKWECVDCNCTMELGGVRHKRMLNNSRSYRPRGCSFSHTYVQSKPTLPLAANGVALPKIQKSTGRSNKAIARSAFATTNSRKGFIANCVSFGIKKTTASTYYQNFKSGKWA